MTPSLVADLNLALDEAMVEHVAWDDRECQVVVALRVLALCSADAVLDARRLLVLDGVTRFDVLLRRDRSGSVDYGPPIPLPDQYALREFLATVSIRDSMHDSKPLDDASATDDWPATPSLAITLPERAAPHSLYWFTECARDEPGGVVAYLLEGLVAFQELSVKRVDGQDVALHTFIEDSRRWWHARWDGDPRASASVQRALFGPAWSR